MKIFTNDWRWSSIPDFTDEECKLRDLDNPTSTRQIPDWERPGRRKKTDAERKAKRNRARAERKRKQKAAKRR